MTTKKYKFHKLSPSFVDENSSFYKISKKALDEAHLDDDVKNIAITGIYGSGKSSFLKTYYKTKDIISVSVADFVNAEEKNERIATAERQILNQILYQIPSSKIPMSKFKVKNKRSLLQVLFYTLLLIISSIGLISIFNKDLLKFIYSTFLKGQVVMSWVNSTTVVFLLIPLIAMSFWLSRRVSLKLTKLSFKGAESELFDIDNAELLDQEARELVYLIVSSDVETIIFEDLDRFKDISIFIRLREINSLVNFNSNKVIRFIYVIEDNLFESKDRTKFFDLIIPVISKITSHNSRSKLLEIFSNIEEEQLKIDPKILEQISIYIDDMRLAYSIRNEYEIYSKSINTDVYANELFSLIVLKNVFPKEFSELEHDQGYLYNILNKRSTLLEQYEVLLREKIKEREELKNQLITKFSDFISVNIPLEYKLPTSKSKGETIYHWYSDENAKLKVTKNGYAMEGKTFLSFVETLCKKDKTLKERLEQINYEDLDIKIKSLTDEIEKLKEALEEKHTFKTSDILAELDEEGLAIYFEENINRGMNIIENHYYPLIRYLVLAGLIDENYWRYKGYFYEGYIGRDDNIFINRVLSGKSIDNNFKLNDAIHVMSYLGEKDYLRKDIVNYDLLEELINKSKDKEICNMMKVIVSTTDVKAIEYINGFPYSKLKQLVDLLLKNGFECFNLAFSSNDFPSQLRLKLAGVACEYKDIQPKEEFKDYLAHNSEILELDILPNKSDLIIGIENMQIQFEDVSKLKISHTIAMKIIEERLFVLNIKNIINLIYRNDTSKEKNQILIELFQILSIEPYIELQKYIEEHLEDVISEYVTVLKELKLKAILDEVALIEILNSNINNEIKQQFISVMSSNIEVVDLASIKEVWVLTELFNNDLVACNENNLNDYYERNGELKSIIGYLNRKYKGEFSLNQDMYIELLNYEATDDVLHRLVSEKFKGEIELISSKLRINQYINLIQNNIIEFNGENWQVLLDTENDELLTMYMKIVGQIEDQEVVVSLLINHKYINQFSMELFTQVLNLNVFEDSANKALIKAYNKQISLFSIKETSYEVRKYVFTDYFLMEDCQRIIKEYDNFDLKEDMIEKLNIDSEVWSEVIEDEQPKEFIDELIKSESLKENLKVNLLERLIENKSHIASWEAWLELIETVNNISSVLSNKRPLMENSEENKIAKALEKIGVISIGENDRLNLKLKKFENMKKENLRDV